MFLSLNCYSDFNKLKETMVLKEIIRFTFHFLGGDQSRSLPSCSTALHIQYSVVVNLYGSTFKFFNKRILQFKQKQTRAKRNFFVVTVNETS